MTANSIYTITVPEIFAFDLCLDSLENVYITDTGQAKLWVLAKVTGTYFGVSMTANNVYNIAGTGPSQFGPISTVSFYGAGITIDSIGNLYFTTTSGIAMMLAKVTGTYFGISMTANNVYMIAAGQNVSLDGLALRAGFQVPNYIALDSVGNVYVSELHGSKIRMLAKVSGTYFGISMTANYLYTIAGGGTLGVGVDGSSLNSTVYYGQGIAVDSYGAVYIAEKYSYKIRKIIPYANIGFNAPLNNITSYIETIAGTGTQAAGADGAPLTSAFFGPIGAALDSIGNLYISDQSSHRIRMLVKVAGTHFGRNLAAGNIYTIAGTGTIGTGADGAPLTSALSGPYGVDVDSLGNLYIAEHYGYRTRMLVNVAGTYFGISMTVGNIYTIAGGPRGNGGNNVSALSSVFSAPTGVRVDSDGNVYIADKDNAKIRMLPKVAGTYFGISMTVGNIYTIAGGGASTTDGPALSSQLSGTYGLGIDSLGNIYIPNNFTMKMLAKATGTYFGISMTANNIYTIAGTGTAGVGVNGPALNSMFASAVYDVAIDSIGNLYTIEYYTSVVRMLAKVSGTYFGISMTANNIYTIAGTGTAGIGSDGAPLTSAMKYLYGIAVDSSRNLYIPENESYRIRKIIPYENIGSNAPLNNNASYIETIAGTGAAAFGLGENGVALTTPLQEPWGLLLDSFGNLYISSWNSAVIRMIPKTTGTYFGISMTANNIYTIAGTGVEGAGANGPALTTKMWGPQGMAVDSLGNLYITETSIGRIRMLAKVTGTYFGISMTANSIYTIAGTGSNGNGGNGAALTSALGFPTDVCLDSDGNVYIAERDNNRIRMLAKTTGTFFGISMTANNIYAIPGITWGGITTDSVGNLYIAENYNHRIRMLAKITGTYFGISMTANTIYTIAGTGTSGFGPDRAAALSSTFYGLSKITLDSAGNVYISEYDGSRIRMLAKVTGTYFGISMTANYVYTIAGTGTQSAGADGEALSSNIYRGMGIAVDSSGAVYIAEQYSYRVRKIFSYTKVSSNNNNNTAITEYTLLDNKTSYILTIAGTGTAGTGTDVAPLSSALNQPYGIAVDSIGNQYIADTANHRIRMIVRVTGTYFGRNLTAGTIYTIAGTGTSGAGANGAPLTSALNTPHEVSVDSLGNIYIADYNNNRVRILANVIGTYYGTSATTLGHIYTIAGTGQQGAGANGAPLTSAFYGPWRMCFDSVGNLYIADRDNHRVRVLAKVTGTFFGISMTANTIYTIAGTGTSGAGANGAPLTSALNYPYSISIDSLDNLYIADNNNHRIRMIPKVTGTFFGISMTANNIYTIAGTGAGGAGIDGAPLSSALNYPWGITIDSLDNLYISEHSSYRIRMLAKVTGTYFGISVVANNIYTIAGTGSLGAGADGAPLTSALTYQSSIIIDSTGILYLSDTGNNRVRMISPTAIRAPTALIPNNIYTIAGTGTAGAGADGAPLRSALNGQEGIIVDSLGNLYIAEYVNHRVRMLVKKTGTYFGRSMVADFIYTIAGTGTAGAGANGEPLTSALNGPVCPTIDSAGNLYIVEYGGSRVRMLVNATGTYFGRLMTANTIYTIAGTGTAGSGANGAPLTSALSSPWGITIDSVGNLYIADTNNHRIKMLANVSGSYFGLTIATLGHIYSIAGTGTAGSGADGVALSSAFSSPAGITIDSVGNLYITDASQRVRMLAKVTGTYFGISMTANSVYAIAGTGTAGAGANGAPLTSALSSPWGICLDSLGNVYIVERVNHRARMLARVTGTFFGISMTANNIYTIAGTGTAGSGANGAPLTSALSGPFGIAIDSVGSLYISDKGNNRIRILMSKGTAIAKPMIPNYIYTIAGGGSSTEDGPAFSTGFGGPFGINVDSVGNIYIADTNNNRIRMMPKVTGTYFGVSMTANSVYTIATGFNAPARPVVDSLGNIYIPDRNSNIIRMLAKVTGTYFGIFMAANNLYTIVGSGLSLPSGVCLDSVGNLYISDGNNVIKMLAKVTGTYFGVSMTANSVYTIATGFSLPWGMVLDSIGNLYIMENNGFRLKVLANVTGTYFGVSMTANSVYTIAGTGSVGTGANGAPLSSQFKYPCDIDIDSLGNIYMADTSNHRIRILAKVTGTYFGVSMTANNIYTIAGTGTGGAGADGPALGSAVNNPYGMCLDSFGNIYIADTNNSKIRMIFKGNYYSLNNTAAPIFNINSGFLVNGVDAVYHNPLLYSTTF
jgi:sugar lactone lactonase YvrE